MLPLAPLLSQRTISQVLLKHLAKLQARFAFYGGICSEILRSLRSEPLIQLPHELGQQDALLCVNAARTADILICTLSWTCVRRHTQMGCIS